MSLTVWYWQPAGLSENKDLWQILLMPLRKFSSLAAAAQCPDRGHFLPSQTQQKHNVNGNVKANTVFLMMNVSKWLVRSKFYTNFFFLDLLKVQEGRTNENLVAYCWNILCLIGSALKLVGSIRLCFVLCAVGIKLGTLWLCLKS